jgi:hypothetical protein
VSDSAVGVWIYADRQPTVSPGSESVTSTTTPLSPSSVTARPTVRSDVKSAKSTLARSGPMSWVGTRERSPSRRVSDLPISCVGG